MKHTSPCPIAHPSAALTNTLLSLGVPLNSLEDSLAYYLCDTKPANVISAYDPVPSKQSTSSLITPTEIRQALIPGDSEVTPSGIEATPVSDTREVARVTL